MSAFRVTVFCSAVSTIDAAFFTAADEFAQGLARRKWELLYGGGQVGLMGRFADAALAAGGCVRGAITEDLAKGHEVAHRGLDELLIVEDLFERKRWMMEEADAFVIFPGGFGTLDEALEVITWKALGCHAKPIVFVNLKGFWQHQIKVFDEFVNSGVVRKENRDLFVTCDTLDDTWMVLDGAAGSV